jgi:hypothetical protein
MNGAEERLHQLFLLNLALQMFDGVATYVGIVHWGEGNPLIVAAIPTLGVGGALLLFKAKACGFLVVLRRLAGHRGVYESFVVLAVAYTALSFIPWMSRFLTLL